MRNLVIKPFIDKDTQIGYSKGDMYESTDSKRIAFLIENGFLKQEEYKTVFPKHIGGGWYELSNGKKVQGKDEALETEESLRGEKS
ncbi:MULTISPECIES: hypothetical protein [unclassified Bacillus (in: firmicutes)]|uniref:hypothetical protein n=1 Tax=unclassified Bacillus (in: firmicutes) TaxID=185979 RepID=UPI0008E17887|nr:MULTISPECIES: hypothetical protein [unclassified Bacillus (in: firmicutes)]SFI36002.1 hypothetical protein SAMN04488574_102454 [Bacillus sp. 71mf]SFS34935.1 hypothetical protein SAMN04488145_10111 [Bacillus sp. 103mf]